MKKQRIILHVDMDAFFAAIEQRDHPEYRGQPLIVGADPRQGRGRGVVSTCSYEARAFGVHSAMPVNQAWRLCPQGIYVPPNGALYSRVSRSIFDVFYEFTDAVEPLSVDEAFLDVTGSVRLFGDGPDMARRIKQRIREKEQLTASVGVASCKFVAKIASDLEKPDGLVVVPPEGAADFLAPLDISRMWGAGAKTQQKLRAMGIKTLGDLAAADPEWLKRKLGVAGPRFHRLARGIDERPVHRVSGMKSISNEHTFDQDTADAALLRRTLARLCEKVGHRLRKADVRARTIHLKLRYDDFNTLTRSHTLPRTFNDTARLMEEIGHLFDGCYRTGRLVRLLGVGVSGLESRDGQQLNLFETENARKPLDDLEDMIKNRFGDHAIHRADGLESPDD
ncbi:MAG: DNA polymerase IV [Calditrichaeota bacterium]|nr:MAG: DNA polymerase IV [Calditrichota bacterium]